LIANVWDILQNRRAFVAIRVGDGVVHSQGI
jgi:hypothetical protein